eukprot:CAMPEP_0198245838 /NCGR_PEP_ID=MMETSP1446-20131203/43181_1 /TAXON_ID=1461542 ORGANISM="Unidentified sp, Strain CCMP2111" /NCGR_SAMPLE_ID=MMETSP1446 /ASSEMBLY_ACC=CAM_ASM_001112 /LENGTH=52 /DNA_ID=CAMNT_0043930081 /DNA_START=1 /DNA_END=156 /DNA_ORIENTATION=-
MMLAIAKWLVFAPLRTKCDLFKGLYLCHLVHTVASTTPTAQDRGATSSDEED